MSDMLHKRVLAVWKETPILSPYFELQNVSGCSGAAIIVLGVLRTGAEFFSLMSPIFVWRMSVETVE